MSVSDIWSPLCFISDFLMGLFANIREQVLAVHIFLVLLVCIFDIWHHCMVKEMHFTCVHF